MAKHDEEIKFPRYLPNRKDVYSVWGYIKNDPETIESGYYVNEKGYVEEKTGYIFIYTSTGTPKYHGIPYMTIENGEVVKYSSTNEEIMNGFHLSKTRYMEPVQIVKETSDGEVLYSEKDLYALNSSSASFAPMINDDDDGLKKLIKKLIAAKGRNINTLKAQTTEKYTLPNIKAALMGPTKMSIKNFNTWNELLGTGYEIRIYDDGVDTQFPLKNDIVYSSCTDKVYIENVEDPESGEPLKNNLKNN